MISSRKTRLASPANVFTIALITSTLLWNVLAPIPKQMPGHQEDDGDDEDEAVHERRVLEDDAGLRVAQGSIREHREQHHHGDAPPSMPKQA